MKRFNPRASAVSGLALVSVVAAVTLTGCGAGQISQTASQESGVNGSSATIGEIALRNVRIQVRQTSYAVQPGKTVDLVFVTTNQSQDTPDRLLSVSSDVGSVAVSGNPTVPPLGTLMVGAPLQGYARALSTVSPATAAAATVTLDKPITTGPLYNFTFTFERNGQAKLRVPIAAPTNAQRMPQAQSTGAGSAGAGH